MVHLVDSDILVTLLLYQLDLLSATRLSLFFDGGLGVRRLKWFPVRQRARRIAEFLNDFSSLRMLPAFSALEVDIKKIIGQKGWKK